MDESWCESIKYLVLNKIEDIDSLETEVDVKKNRWNVKQSGVFKQKKSTTVPNENTYSSCSRPASVKLIHRKLSLTPFDPDRKYKHEVKLL